MNKKVSVIITAYNEEKKIERSVCSILNQTYKEIELIIINDGSTDRTIDVINKFCDPRIHVVNRENLGRIKSLNEGLKIAKGEYIAINDADDYSELDRIEKQVRYLDSNDDVGVLGTSYFRIDSIRGEKYIRHYPTEDYAIKRDMCKYIPICQGTVMYRRNLIINAGGYNENFEDIEDLELWIRVGRQTKFANLRIPLYTYDLSMDTSYFHNNYSSFRRNLTLLRLSMKAIKVFRLPIWLIVFPVGRFFYPAMPKFLKKIIRKSVSDIIEDEI